MSDLEAFLTKVPVGRGPLVMGRPFAFHDTRPPASLANVEPITHGDFLIRVNQDGAAVYANGVPVAWMQDFKVPYVRPEYRNRGLAKEMVIAYWRANKGRPLPKPPTWRTPEGARLFQSVFEAIKEEL